MPHHPQPGIHGPQESQGVMSAAATATDPVTIEALDFDLTCQIEHWYIFMPAQAKPACGKPADYHGAVHNFHTCTAVEKFICAECLPGLQKSGCPTCGAVRVTNLSTITKA